jgi:hypothetical protein
VFISFLFDYYKNEKYYFTSAWHYS